MTVRDAARFAAMLIVSLWLWAAFQLVTQADEREHSTCHGSTGVYVGPWGQQHVEPFDPACGNSVGSP